MAIKEELIRLVRADPEVRDAMRREILTGDLLDVPASLNALIAAQRRTEERVEALAAAQLRTEQHLEALTAAQLHTEQRLEALTQRVDALTQRVEALTQRVEALVTVVERLAGEQERTGMELRRMADWQRGEQGRREGERYERDTIRHADAIFGGGRGAAERPEDLERLRSALAPVVAAPTELADRDNPFLADLLWLKAGRIAVVEISHRVDRQDVERAERRAATLRGVGLLAQPIVIGQDWASADAEEDAAGRSIEWRIGGTASDGYLEFRRAPAA